MIKKLANPKNQFSIFVAQLEFNANDPDGNKERREGAVAKAIAAGASIIASGGEAGSYEDDNVIIVTDDAVFASGTREKRLRELSAKSVSTGKPLVYVGAVGVRDGGKAIRVYDGGSCYFTPDGTFRELFDRFEEANVSLDIASEKSAGAAIHKESFDSTAEAILFGTKSFMRRLGLERIVVGISGGIDSAVSAALYGAILPPENLLLISMPGPFTSQTTRGLARKLATNLGSRFAEIPIGEAVDLTARQFAELKSEGPGGGVTGAWELSPFAIENVQARDRGSRVLSAAAAAFGGVLSCNANKAETTIGYGTLHGDIIGWLSCLGDLWKGEVYQLGKYLNEKVYKREAIPEMIFKIKPSAELSDSQSIDKGLGDPLNYPYHDKLFRSWVEDCATPQDSLSAWLDGSLADRIGYEGKVESLFSNRAAFSSDVCRWWNLFKGLAVAKRLQAPPILAVSKKAFGEFAEFQSAKKISL